ncbi:type III pantothenate kinase [Actomonas aquatica]|uniref:Type III pantothenate kinase n=1 Tax=Actomonas aquatica TaxID=2866162 RepID=A0ABZ1C667_9BACT|nr:type III pantothenate kinase [Opitutus sp. WL0086]WRQ87094.1 type III pantothenate kinase [Opitutus sp. WL0086]
MLACIDIGNTHTHFGFCTPGGLSAATDTGEVKTASLEALLPLLETRRAELTAIAFCSVVPAAVPRLRTALVALDLPLWQLTHEVKLGVDITYPRPAEIGQDRLANAAGAAALGPLPAVVIDLGTAVTFDIVTDRGGYEGGIITPGPSLMTRYLHEHTAQLPLVEDVTSPVTSAIGKSTVEAMRIGAVLGFTGLMQACLDGVEGDLTAAGEPTARVITCGGAYALVRNRLRQPTTDIPDLTLRGLAAAWALNQGSG